MSLFKNLLLTSVALASTSIVFAEEEKGSSHSVLLALTANHDTPKSVTRTTTTATVTTTTQTMVYVKISNKEFLTALTKETAPLITSIKGWSIAWFTDNDGNDAGYYLVKKETAPIALGDRISMLFDINEDEEVEATEVPEVPEVPPILTKTARSTLKEFHNEVDTTFSSTEKIRGLGTVTLKHNGWTINANGIATLHRETNESDIDGNADKAVQINSLVLSYLSGTFVPTKITDRSGVVFGRIDADNAKPVTLPAAAVAPPSAN